MAIDRTFVGRALDHADTAFGRLGAPLLKHQTDRAGRAGPDTSGGLRLHLGCGSVRLPGWCNVDIGWRTAADVHWNLRYGLPLPAGCATRIYSEHFFEHIPLASARRLLRDCRRVLQPDGVLRIAMPDLERVVHNYLNDWRDVEVLKDPAYRFIDSPAHYINFVFRAWGHRYLYDFADLERRLLDAGFSRVARCTHGSSGHHDLRDMERRAESLLIVEANP